MKSGQQHPTEETHMADPTSYPDTGDDTGVGSDDESNTNTPRWVKVFGIIALVAVLLFAVLQFTGNEHGPSRHMPASVTEQSGQQP